MLHACVCMQTTIIFTSHFKLKLTKFKNQSFLAAIRQVDSRTYNAIKYKFCGSLYTVYS